MKGIKGGWILPLLFFSLISPAAFSQEEMQMLFKVDCETSFDWFQSDDNTRGMAINPKGSLLVVDRVPETVVHRLNPQNGSSIGYLNMTGVEGGYYDLNKIGVSRDGRIFATNLALPNQPLKIYYWENESASPIVIYEAATDKRVGDSFDVAGSGASIKLVVYGAGFRTVHILSDHDGDGQFTMDQFAPGGFHFSGSQTLCWGPDLATLWFRRNTTNGPTASRMMPLASRSTIEQKYAPAKGYGPLDVERYGTQEIMAIGPGRYSQDEIEVRGLVCKPAEDFVPLYVTESGLEKTGGSLSNTNGAGDVCIDPVRGNVYFLYTNNSISGWQMPTP